MNQEVLERLLIDQAMRALPSDVDALLQAYVAEVPACRDRQRDIVETVQLAKRALPAPPALPLPPLKLAPLAQPAARNRIRAWWPAELAAIFLLGLGLGAWLRPPSPRLESEATSLVTPAVNRPAAQETRVSGFWSTARLARLESKTSTPARPEISWSSPVRKPQLNP